MRYFIELAYKGTRYFGWQIQQNAITVQQVIEEALQVYFKQEVKVTGAGRTDTGVHASYFVAHFELKDVVAIDSFGFLKSINALLPEDVAVYSITPVGDQAHARFSAISRAYEYHIHNKKNPFKKELSYRLYRKLDVESMNECAQELLKVNDFSSFAKVNSQTKTNVCKVFYANWNYNENEYVFSIKADRFLRNMVRAIVGTLLDIGSLKITKEQFLEIIHAKNRSKAGTSVPPQGLYLVDIQYPGDVFKKYDNTR